MSHPHAAAPTHTRLARHFKRSREKFTGCDDTGGFTRASVDRDGGSASALSHPVLEGSVDEHALADIAKPFADQILGSYMHFHWQAERSGPA